MVNVGTLDRTIRFVVGLALAATAFAPPLSGWVAALGAWKYALTVWGFMMLATAALRFCPAYTLLGISTCPLERR